MTNRATSNRKIIDIMTIFQEAFKEDNKANIWNNIIHMMRHYEKELTHSTQEKIEKEKEDKDKCGFCGELNEHKTNDCYLLHINSLMDKMDYKTLYAIKRKNRKIIGKIQRNKVKRKKKEDQAQYVLKKRKRNEEKKTTKATRSRYLSEQKYNRDISDTYGETFRRDT